MCLGMITVCLLLLFPSFVFAQMPGENFLINNSILSLGVLFFGLIILSFQMGIMIKMGKGWGTNSIRIVGITLVIISGIFLITTGYSTDKVSPMIGLLGTIAGYLLGKEDKRAD